MNKWPVRQIKEIAQVFDGPHATPKKTEDGPWFLSISSLDRGKLRLSESAHLSEEEFTRWTRRVTPQPGDVLFSYETRLGDAALMPDGLRACLGRRMGLLRPNRSQVDPRFLLFAYLAQEFQETIQTRRIHGATVDRIPLAELPHWPIRIPNSLKEQEAIAAALGALDDKIVVNDLITTTADELRSSFLADAIQEFRNKFQEQTLSSVAKFINGRAFTKNASGAGRMVIRIAEINSGPGSSTIYNGIEVSEEHLARPGDVLFAWSGSLTVARWFRPESIINQHIFKVIPKGDYPRWLVFELVRFKLQEFRSIAADKATTMGHIQRHHLDEPVPIPSAEILQKLDTRCLPLWERALAAEQESLALARFRDTLLPELMSGRLRVRDAERMVEDAV